MINKPHTIMPALVTAAFPRCSGCLGMLMLSLILLMTPQAAAQFGQSRESEEVVRVRVIPEKTQVAVGETFHLAIVFDIKPSWHLYWKNPGAGAAPVWIEVAGPDSCEIGKVRWPRPKTIKSEVGDMYCYEGQTILFVPVQAQHASPRGTAAMFQLEIGWAVCDDATYLMGDIRTTAQVLLAQGSGGDKPPVRTPPLLPPDLPGGDRDAHDKLMNDIKQRLKQLPVPLTDDAAKNQTHKAQVNYEQGVLTITGPAHDMREATFFPGGVNGISFRDVTCEIDREDNTFRLTAAVEINRSNFIDAKPRITGLIALGKEPADPSYEFSLPVPASRD